ncbi:hypothetical protein JCM30237_08610 [Halolamina litorea]|jgi:hypothetical protein|uniref:SnoaL-like domain-containing protein n=1 Tax=Halolamina litorea TaxID=1515593 RepID=A0ABD6BRK2_9EURY|nr:hypothetical protein [Halolamina litorea]
MHDRYARLVRLISDYVDRNFRAAFQYDERDWTALYVRPDLATEDLQAAVPALADRARSHEPLVREPDYPELGTQRASISLHAEAVLVHFNEGPQSGVVATLETDVARNLSQFVARCESVLFE